MARPLLHYDFTRWRGWTDVDDRWEPSTNEFRQVHDPVRVGTGAALVAVGGNRRAERVEINKTDRMILAPTEGHTIWLAFSLLALAPLVTKQATVMQNLSSLHRPGVAGMNMAIVAPKGKTVASQSQILIAGGDVEHPTVRKLAGMPELTLGVWHDFLLHVRYHRRDGLLECFHRTISRKIPKRLPELVRVGKPYAGPTSLTRKGRSDNRTVKHGIYKGENADWVRLYLGGLAADPDRQLVERLAFGA